MIAVQQNLAGIRCTAACFLVLGLPRRVLDYYSVKHGRSKTVELSVKVDYIATCVVFAFIAAILLGAF